MYLQSIYTYTCMCIYIYICMYMYGCIYTYVYTYICIYILHGLVGQHRLRDREDEGEVAPALVGDRSLSTRMLS